MKFEKVAYNQVNSEKEDKQMDYFNTQAGQNTMESISLQLSRTSYQLSRIADALEFLAAAWGKEQDKKEEDDA